MVEMHTEVLAELCKINALAKAVINSDRLKEDDNDAFEDGDTETLCRMILEHTERIDALTSAGNRG